MLDDAAAAAPDVSIVVVNYRSTDLTVQALAAATAAAPGLAVEEIVADAGSETAELERLKAARPDARIVELGENLGFAAGNNAGIADARGRNLLLVNPDAFALGDAVAKLIRHLDADPGLGVAAPMLLNEDGTIQDNAHKRFPNLATLFVDFCAPVAFLIRGSRLDPHHLPRRRLAGPVPIAHATGAVLAVRRAAADAAGPMDDRFFLYLEETEWQRRIAAAGWGREVVPGARFTHLGGGSSDSFALASPNYLRSIGLYYPRPRASRAVIWMAAVLSLVALRVALALGAGSQRTRRLAAAYGDLIRLLRSRA